MATSSFSLVGILTGRKIRIQLQHFLYNPQPGALLDNLWHHDVDIVLFSTDPSSWFLVAIPATLVSTQKSVPWRTQVWNVLNRHLSWKVMITGPLWSSSHKIMGSLLIYANRIANNKLHTRLYKIIHFFYLGFWKIRRIVFASKKWTNPLCHRIDPTGTAEISELN